MLLGVLLSAVPIWHCLHLYNRVSADSKMSSLKIIKNFHLVNDLLGKALGPVAVRLCAAALAWVA